jgi:type IX secretion system PorP/SprF family membrane protein
MIMRNFYILLTVFYSLTFIAQQDPQYNLYQFNPLVINPAYAGARDGISVAANVRNQWVGFAGAPKTNVLSVHAPVLNKNIGLGLTVINDKMGPRNMIGAQGNFSYILKLSSKWKLSFGLSAGYNRYQFNYSELTFKSMDNSTAAFNNVNTGALDFGSGLYLKSNSFFFGFSATHLFANELFKLEVEDTARMGSGNLSYRLRTHNFVTIGKSFVINKNLVFAPTLMLRSIRTGGNNIDMNLNFFIYNKLWLGVFLRGPYGPGFLFNYYATPHFKVGYSFDMGLREARMLGPSHEVCIGFDFLGKKSKIVSPRFL